MSPLSPPLKWATTYRKAREYVKQKIDRQAESLRVRKGEEEGERERKQSVCRKQHPIPFHLDFKDPEQRGIGLQLKGGGHLHPNLAAVGYVFTLQSIQPQLLSTATYHQSPLQLSATAGTISFETNQICSAVTGGGMIKQLHGFSLDYSLLDQCSSCGALK